MKKLFLFTLVFGSFIACKSKKESNTTSTEEVKQEQTTVTPTTLTVESGVINWKGSKLLGSSHNGTLQVSQGTISTVDGKVVSGTFTIDMNTIHCLDLEGQDGQKKLEGHLKNADFFDVENHPTSTFKIKTVLPLEGSESLTHQLIGDLTIKGITNAINIPVNISKNGENFSITSETFQIDRTKWNIEFNSQKLIGDIKDKIINDNIDLSIEVTAQG